MRKNILDRFKDRFDNFNDWIEYNNVFFNIYEPEFRIKIKLDDSHKELESYARNIAPMRGYKYYNYIFNYNGLDICDIPVVVLDCELFIPLPKRKYAEINNKMIPIWFYCKDDLRHKLFSLLNKKLHRSYYINKLPIIIFEDKDEMFDFVKYLEENRKEKLLEIIDIIEKSTDYKEIIQERMDKEINFEYIRYLRYKEER